jgi:hypothetical protein
MRGEEMRGEERRRVERRGYKEREEEMRSEREEKRLIHEAYQAGFLGNACIHMHTRVDVV